ncbi:hypothetical protein V5799_004931 [Amblyomma americanum]|uniref:Uncharacterized protein n=1 Tax=Amblyomma americanum TaxID=6943 RepID=A0AAQ4D4Q4_AMBAM
MSRDKQASCRRVIPRRCLESATPLHDPGAPSSSQVFGIEGECGAKPRGEGDVSVKPVNPRSVASFRSPEEPPPHLASRLQRFVGSSSGTCSSSRSSRLHACSQRQLDPFSGFSVVVIVPLSSAHVRADCASPVLCATCFPT